MDTPFYAFFEDRRAPAGEPAAWLFESPVDCLVVSDASSLANVLNALQGEGLWAVAALDYELGYLLEPASAPSGWLPDPLRPLARFWRFSQCRKMNVSEADRWLAEQIEGQPSGIGGLQSGLDEKAYADAVDRIKHYISEGDCYQVNFTFPLEFSWFGQPLALYGRLRERQPVRYGGFVGNAASAIVSLSPELFLEKKGPRLITRPMKGTAPRHESAEILRNSAKDKAENLMIVDLLRNDLGRVAAKGSVTVDRLFDIESYPSVWQMVSEISAEVPETGFGDILQALFPCGSITGAPKIRAMQIAAETESRPRHLYTGALGWRAPTGDFRLNVAIRTLELAADRSASMGIGSGIVADSEKGAEWQECLLKAGFLRHCDPGLQLIETLRRESGIYPRLQGHVQRLQRSAAWLDFPLDESAMMSALDTQPVTGVWRVRLTLDKSGVLAVHSFPLAPEPISLRKAQLSVQAIDAVDPLRGHKTTSRHLYDAALRYLSSDSPIFDVVFLNQRGEVAEGARSNVFVERDGVLLTPPLASGALPGVLRAELLASGRARETVLWPEDLEAGFWLGNALRGLIFVTWDTGQSRLREN